MGFTNAIAFYRASFYKNPRQVDTELCTVHFMLKIYSHNNPTYINLSYTINSNQLDDDIELTSIPSNLGRGRIWPFICPQTGISSRVLYFDGEHYKDRKAFKHAMCRSQTHSKNKRELIQMFDGAFAQHRVHQIYFRPYYRGKPTRTLKPLLKKQEQSKGYSVEEIAVMRT